MNIKLTIQEKLEDLRRERKLSQKEVAEQIGISKSSLSKYEKEDFKDISPYALVSLAKFYGVSTDYLLGLSETKQHENTDIHDLHISDDMIDLLKSGKINNRLLCEIATHKDFVRLMVDIEVLVDRFVDTQINNLNMTLEAIRQIVLAQTNADENDVNMRALSIGQVNTDEFFHRIIHKDMDVIVSDIKKAHTKDTNTADAPITIEHIQGQLMSAIEESKSPLDAAIRQICIQLNIPFEHLSSEEYTSLLNFVSKSPKLQTGENMRGKKK